MGFSLLPPELVHDIFLHVDRDDLESLCLVSRLAYSEALPFLYDSIGINCAEKEQRSFYGMLAGMASGDWADGKLDMKEIDRISEAYDVVHEKYFATLAKHPNYAKYLKNLELCLYLEDPPNLEDTYIEQAKYLLRMSTNLRFLAIVNAWRYDDPCEKHIGTILARVPPSVVKLDLTGCNVTPETILKLLGKLPRLKTLTLASDYTQGEWRIRNPPPVTPKLVHLDKLYLLHPFHGRFFLQKLLYSSDSLRSIWTAPFSLQALSPRFVSHLTELVVVGEFHSPAYPLSTLVNDLVSTLESCHNLHTFKLVAKDEEPHLELWRALSRIEILQYLPQSIRQISLHYTQLNLKMIARYLHSAPSLFKRIELDRLIRLEEDQIDESGEVFDLAGIDRVDEVAKGRGIEVGWYCQGETWEDIQERNRQMCEAIKALSAQWEKEGRFRKSTVTATVEAGDSAEVAEGAAGSPSDSDSQYQQLTEQKRLD